MTFLIFSTFLLGWVTSRVSGSTTSTLTTYEKPLWSDFSISPTRWEYGYPRGQTPTMFCNDSSSKEGCPEIPPPVKGIKSSNFIQFFGESSVDPYWIGTEIDSRSVGTDKPTDLKLDFIGFGVFGNESQSNKTSIGYIVLTIKLDDIYLANNIFLDEYPLLGWNDMSVMFRNHSGTPFSLQISYLNVGYQGVPIRVVFRGLRLWWV